MFVKNPAATEIQHAGIVLSYQAVSLRKSRFPTLMINNYIYINNEFIPRPIVLARVILTFSRLDRRDPLFRCKVYEGEIGNLVVSSVVSSVCSYSS